MIRRGQRLVSLVLLGLLVLLLGCGSPQREATSPAEPAERVERADPQPAHPQPADPHVVAEAPPALPEIAEATVVDWPARFLGRPLADLIADTSNGSSTSLMSLYRDDGHRAFELQLVPIDDASGWVVDRGVVTSPDYSQTLYERWSHVEARGAELVIHARFGRSEATVARDSEREARYDAIVAHRERCVEGCENRRCRYLCTRTAAQQLAVPHRVALGDASVTIHAPTIRIDRGGVTIGLEDIDESNMESHPTRPAPFFAQVRRTALDSERDAIVIGYGRGCDEDAFCTRSRVFVLDEGIRELEGDFRSAARIELPGDGTIRWVERAIRMCEPTRRQRDAHFASVDPDMADTELWWWHQQREIRLGIRVAAGVTSALRRRPQPWGECSASIAAACPYVDIVTGDETVRVGEILRHIRDEPATQGLTLPALAGDHVRIRLSEEKPETTHLDAVWLELDGERIDPSNHDLAADGRYEIMRRGDAIELEFPLRPHVHARLVAVGYYSLRR